MNHRTTDSAVSPAARLRGLLAGAATALTALSGHGLADGHLPGSRDLTWVAVVGVGLGALIGSAPVLARPARLLAALTAGQGLSHMLLTVSTPGHPMTVPMAMLAAHASAVVAATVLIVLAEAAVHRLGHCARRLRGLLVHYPQPSTRYAHHPALRRTPVPRMRGGRGRGGLTRRGPPAGPPTPIHRT